MKNLITLFTLIFIFSSISVFAAEKRADIKGIFIGMPISEARTTLINNLGDGWKATEIGATNKILFDYRFGNEQIYGKDRGKEFYVTNSLIGDYGFSIHRNECHEGFISSDQKTNKVTRITLSGAITNNLYYPGKKLDMEDFVRQYTNHYQLPEFSWIAFGWLHESRYGYVIVFKTNGLIDIKEDANVLKKFEPIADDKKIKFD